MNFISLTVWVERTCYFGVYCLLPELLQRGCAPSLSKKPAGRLPRMVTAILMPGWSLSPSIGAAEGFSKNRHESKTS
ncbi:hypothetical protein [Desulfosporosinus sp.]|uniref:hypothetical protein n=1 Tax=Desulfosporosinus sp. TaxID=157907 RepID=UPI0026204895|nr:hypothetical protein [Desulfosporosinus sp.]